MPEMVQIGNEINQEMLGRADWKGRAIDWSRDAMSEDSPISGYPAIRGGQRKFLADVTGVVGEVRPGIAAMRRPE